MRCPQRTALARQIRDGSLFAALRSLESRGLVRRQRLLARGVTIRFRDGTHDNGRYVNLKKIARLSKPFAASAKLTL